MNDRELDAEFERIISGWDEEAADPQVRPATELGEPGPKPEPPDGGDRAGDGPGGSSGPDDPSDAGTSDAGSSRPESASDAVTGGLTLSIAPTTSHVWRGGPTPAEDVDELLEQADPDGEDHFEPPTLDELPTAEDDPMFWAIVAGLGGGPLLLLYLLIFDRDGSGWWVATALAMTVVGFVLLVLRGGNERDPFDDGTRV